MIYSDEINQIKSMFSGLDIIISKYELKAFAYILTVIHCTPFLIAGGGSQALLHLSATL
jgi:hypothetical protein